MEAGEVYDIRVLPYNYNSNYYSQYYYLYFTYDTTMQGFFLSFYCFTEFKEPNVHPQFLYMKILSTQIISQPTLTLVVGMGIMVCITVSLSSFIKRNVVFL